MTFWQAFKATYSGSVAVLIACPLLALVPVVFELLQHVVEVHIGMYDSIAAARATEHHPLRMVFGMLKVAALTIPFYWVTRFQPDRDATFAARPDPKAIRLFAVYCMFQLGLAALQLFGLPQTGAVLAICCSPGAWPPRSATPPSARGGRSRSWRAMCRGPSPFRLR
jgi:hypothetical protein